MRSEIEISHDEAMTKRHRNKFQTNDKGYRNFCRLAVLNATRPNNSDPFEAKRLRSHISTGVVSDIRPYLNREQEGLFNKLHG